jgi:signal transduction histidine kinase
MSDLAILACFAKAPDREVARRVLREAELGAELFETLDELLDRATSGAGALLLEEEVLAGRLSRLKDCLGAQPSWSNLPVVLLARRSPGGTSSAGSWASNIRNVMVVERPVGAAALTSALEAALDARRRQYEVRDLLESLRRLNETLEQRVAARTADLERSNSELEQFAYVASHDLQEPLRMVTGFMGLLKRNYDDRLDDKAREYVDFAVDGAQRMSELIRDLLDFSRVGTRGREWQPVEMRWVLDKALQQCGTAIRDSGAEVVAGELPTVCGDERQLVQLLQNFITNAIKFRREGVDPRIEVSAERQDERWLLSVADNGIGIDLSQAERVFEIFQRLHTRDRYEGTGIGLAICRKIVERHGGRIWVESTPGEGSTFYFTLPVAKDAPE